MLSLKLQDFSAQAGWCKVAAAVLFFVALLFLVQLKSERKQGERGRVTCCEGSQVVFKLWDTCGEDSEQRFLFITELFMK